MNKEIEQKYLQALKKASEKIKDLSEKVDALKKKEPIAVIGMGCRFPGGANNPEAYWRILEQGVDTIKEIPPDRWNAELFYDADARTPGKAYSKYGGSLTSLYTSTVIFGISPVEAESMDPQQRLLLEVSWEALEHAGLDTHTLKGSRTGVFIGMDSYDYFQAHLGSGDPTKINEYSVTGIAFSTATGRLSYTYDFRGRAWLLTRLAPPLTALHLAVLSLQNRESDMALLAGGVDLILTPESYIGFSKLNALAADGRCRPFDNAASGYTKGEGCGLVILKRLSDAEKDGDTVLAVIKGPPLIRMAKAAG